MGDVVIQTSLFAWIKQNFPSAKITLITSDAFTPLVESHKFIDEIISFSKTRGISDFKNLYHLSKKIKADVLIDLHNTLRAKVLRSFCLGIPAVKVNKRTFLRFLLIKFKKNYLGHLESHHERTIIDFEFLFQKLYERDSLEEFVENQSENGAPSLTSNSVSFNQNVPMHLESDYIVISPVASFSTKLWPIESYINLCEKMIKSEKFKKFEFVILGGPKDFDCLKFDRIESERVHNFQGKTSFLESSEIISKASLVITNDTGVLHLGESFGIPVVSFFGPTSPDFGFRPHLKHSKTFYANVACSPCSATGSKPCFQPSLICMESISVDSVFREIEKMEI